MRPTRKPHDDHDADAEPIDEGPDERDLDPEESEDDAPTDDCPTCGREIHADSEWCPYCGECPERGISSFRWWLWLGAALALVALFAGFVMRG